jgi:hypothetical protein
VPGDGGAPLAVSRWRAQIEPVHDNLATNWQQHCPYDHQGKRIKLNRHEGSEPVYFSGSDFSWVPDVRKMSVRSGMRPKALVSPFAITGDIRGGGWRVAESLEKP